MWLNIIFPILSGVADVIYYYSIKDPLNEWGSKTLLMWIFTVLVVMVGVLQCISGVILTKAVLVVRRFLIDNDHREMINLKQMLIHSGAFVMYLVAEVVYYGTWTMRIDRSAENLLIYAQFGTSLYLILNFASQVLLMVIFYDLGDEEKVLFEDEEIELDPFAMMLAEFDEEQDLQARIWNRF